MFDGRGTTKLPELARNPVEYINKICSKQMWLTDLFLFKYVWVSGHRKVDSLEMNVGHSSSLTCLKIQEWQCIDISALDYCILKMKFVSEKLEITNASSLVFDIQDQ